MDAQKRYDKKMPTVSFRVTQEDKKAIIKFGEKRGFIDKETKAVNINKAMATIIDEFLIAEGIIRINKEYEV